MLAYQDPYHPGNSSEFHNGQKCIEKGCDDPAGTRWSPLWCFKHNVARMDRIGATLEAAVGKPPSTEF